MFKGNTISPRPANDNAEKTEQEQSDKRVPPVTLTAQPMAGQGAEQSGGDGRQGAQQTLGVPGLRKTPQMGFPEDGAVDEGAQVLPRLKREAREAHQGPVQEQQGPSHHRLDAPAGVDQEKRDYQINQGDALEHAHDSQVGEGKVV